MSGAVLGVDIGNDSLKLALCKDRSIRKTAVARMPAGLLRNGRVESVPYVSDLIRTTMRENHIHASRAAVVLPPETVCLRTLVMPRMSAEQLAYNLPYEFSDYLTEDLKHYVFDYAMITDFTKAASVSPVPEMLSGGQESVPGMELMAAAVSRSVLEEFQAILRGAGTRLVKAAPGICGYMTLIRMAENMRGGGAAREYCILDMGFRSIRMHIFYGDRHLLTRSLDTGLSVLDGVIAGMYQTDTHLAHTYLLSNYEDCQNSDPFRNTCRQMAAEVARSLDFYRSSTPDNQLGDVWLSGGGAVIQPLRLAIAETLEMKIHGADELVQGGEKIDDCYECLQAIALSMD